MSLDLGAVVGRVVLEDVEFQRTYVRIVRQFSSLGAEAEKGAAGTATLDEALAAVGKSSTTAATGLGRATKATADESIAAKRAALAEEQRAAAITRVAAVMAPLATATAKEQQATLRDVAAQERLAAARQGATTEAGRQATTTARLASAQAAAVASTDRLAAAQGAGASSAGFFAGRLGGVLRMAGQLGLIVGAIGAIKAGIDITKEANDYQRAMVQVQTTTNTTAAEVNLATGALLKMAGPVAAAPADLATAWYHAKSVGLDYAKSIDTTRIAAEGARVGHADLEQTMNALTSTVASGIPGVENMSGAMGQLIATVGAGDMKLSDLNAALSSGILTVVKGYGLSLTDVGAALATFGDNNIRGAEAATMLRMAVQAMAVPAKAGRDELTKLGLSTTQLAKDMQEGGLNKAVLDLKAHLDAAHVSSVQVGAVLTEVFGKRAGPGIAVLISQVDRLESKFAVLRSAGSTFDEKWQATTQTASFALARVGHMAEAAGISLTAKLGPSIAQVANWLGTSLPHAISVLAQILGPTVHTLGGDLVGAFHAVLMVLGPVVTVLGAVGHILAQHSTLVSAVVSPLLMMWAAWKGYTIVSSAAAAVRLAFARMSLSATTSLTSMSRAAVGLAGGLGPVGLAVAAIGVALVGATMHSQAHSDALAREKDLMGQLTDAIKSDAGALGAHSRAVITDALASSGALASARQLGISLSDVTAAALGNAGALDRVNKAAGLTAGGQKFLAGMTDQQRAAILSSSDASDKHTAAQMRLNDALNISTGAVRGAVQLAKDEAAANKVSADSATGSAGAHRQLATVLHWVVDASGNLVQTTAKVAGVSDAATAALQAQTTASNALKTAEDLLNGVNESVETSTDSLSIALGNLASGQSLATDKNGHAIRSLKQSTVAGATNRQMLVGLIDAAKAQAQATADQAAKTHNFGQSLAIGNKQLAANEDAIRRAAHAAGLNKGEVDKLIASMGILSKVHPKPKVDADTTPAETKTRGVFEKLGMLNVARANATVGVTDHASEYLRIIRSNLFAIPTERVINIITRTGTVKMRASGGGAPEGWYWTGEQGPELNHKSGSNVQVFSAPQSRAMAGVLGTKIPGFASGTGGSSDLARAIAVIRAILSAATRPAPTTVAGIRGAFEWNAHNAVDKRIDAEKAWASYAKARDAAAAYTAAVNKIPASQDKARAAAQKTADAATAAASKAHDAWSSLNDQANSAAQNAADKATALIQKLNDVQAAFASKVGDFRSAISGGISGGTTLTSLWSDTGGDASTMQRRADVLLAAAKRFAGDLKHLATLGVSPPELQQIAGLGSESGDALAKQLIALGPARLKALNASLDAIQNVGGSTAASLAQGFYGTGAASMASMLKGLESRYPSLVAGLRPIVARIASMFHFTPVVTAPHYTGSGYTPRHYANGGKNILGGYALVGERGPEVAWLPPHSNVYPTGTMPPAGDQSALLDRLERIEAAVLASPAATGDRVGERVLQGVDRYGQAQARELERIGRQYR